MIDDLRVEPGDKADLDDRPTRVELDDIDDKDQGKDRLRELVNRAFELQRKLWAEDRRSVLFVIQGMDTAGKDGTIRRVFGRLNPQGVSVASFKAPSATERDHDYLWRVHAQAPRRGEIGIFNRSHYEDVGIVRVEELVPKEQWKQRYRHIREFERLLADEGTTIRKMFMHISKGEQRERLQERIDRPEKHWKFNLEDLDTRKKWDDYMEAYEDAITETSTEWAPWYVIPADSKWRRDVIVARLLVDTLEEMDPEPPPPDPRLEGVTVE